MFTQKTSYYRLIYQPVEEPVLKTQLQPGGGGECFELPKPTMDALTIIEKFYSSKLSTAAYASIPGANMNKYFELYETIQDSIKNNNCPDVSILLKIAEETLHGSLNAYNLNYINTTLKISNAQLQKSNNEILEGLNTVKAVSNTSGQFVLTKKFTLAPIFSYYIMLYGFPAQGVGFDPNKLTLLQEIMENNGIDTYK